MAIVGLGVDLVDVDHFRRLTERDDESALGRMFTKSELAARRSGVHQSEQLAGWFSAKEAVLKALGVGQSQGVAWTDIEVTTNSMGAAKRLPQRAHQGDRRGARNRGLAHLDQPHGHVRNGNRDRALSMTAFAVTGTNPG